MIGAETKATPPTALLLRSGDAVVLSGPARRCNHGLPRVLTDQPAEALQCSGACAEGRSAADGTDAGPAFEPFARHIQACRINISIRDTR